MSAGVDGSRAGGSCGGRASSLHVPPLVSRAQAHVLARRNGAEWLLTYRRWRVETTCQPVPVDGEVAERLNAAVLKTADRKVRGFESHPLRQ